VAYLTFKPLNTFHVLQSSVPESSPLEDIKEQKTGIHNPVDRKGTCLPGSQNSGEAMIIFFILLSLFCMSRNAYSVRRCVCGIIVSICVLTN
jgi:hypothetical protein